MEVLGKKFEFWSELGIKGAYFQHTIYCTVGIKYCTWENSIELDTYRISWRFGQKIRTIYCT